MTILLGLFATASLFALAYCWRFSHVRRPRRAQIARDLVDYLAAHLGWQPLDQILAAVGGAGGEAGIVLTTLLDFGIIDARWIYDHRRRPLRREFRLRAVDADDRLAVLTATQRL